MADFETLDSSYLISRKICETQKFSDFHTVLANVLKLSKIYKAYAKLCSEIV